MNILKRFKCLFSIITVFAILLVGCGVGSPKSLSGSYVATKYPLYGEIYRLEFFSDGKYSSDHPNYHGEYSIDGNRIWLEGLGVEDITYYFRLNGDKLEFDYQEDFSSSDVFVKN